MVPYIDSYISRDLESADWSPLVFFLRLWRHCGIFFPTHRIWVAHHSVREHLTVAIRIRGMRARGEMYVTESVLLSRSHRLCCCYNNLDCTLYWGIPNVSSGSGQEKKCTTLKMVCIILTTSFYKLQVFTPKLWLINCFLLEVWHTFPRLMCCRHIKVEGKHGLLVQVPWVILDLFFVYMKLSSMQITWIC